jgi:hypothetical protein
MARHIKKLSVFKVVTTYLPTLLFFISRSLDNIQDDPLRYRLLRETMMQALRQLGGKILSEVAEAELLLQTAYFAWQNSSNNSCNLLSGEELKKVMIGKKLQPVL